MNLAKLHFVRVLTAISSALSSVLDCYLSVINRTYNVIGRRLCIFSVVPVLSCLRFFSYTKALFSVNNDLDSLKQESCILAWFRVAFCVCPSSNIMDTSSLVERQTTGFKFVQKTHCADYVVQITATWLIPRTQEIHSVGDIVILMNNTAPNIFVNMTLI